MARGTPDWTERVGEQVIPAQDTSANQDVNIISILGNVTAGATSTFSFSIVDTGQEHLYKNLIVSCEDDSAIQRIRVFRSDEGTIRSSGYFILNMALPFDNWIIGAGDRLKADVKNNAAGTVSFRITATRIERKAII